MEAQSTFDGAARAAALLGIGGLCFLLSVALVRAGAGSHSARGDPQLWIADRDGAALVTLDQDGLVLDQHEVAGVLELAHAADGDLWGLVAPVAGGVARGLRRLLPAAADPPSLHFPAGAHSLGALADGSLGLILRTETESLWLRLDGEGRPVGSVPAGEALAWEMHGDSLALTGADWIRWYGRSHAPLEWRASEESELLAQCSQGTELWVLTRNTSAAGQVRLRIWRFDGPMHRVQVLDLGSGLARLGGLWRLTSGSASTLWMVSSSGLVIQLDLDSGRWRPSELQPPVVDTTSDGAGGVFALTPGGLQRLDKECRLQPGQGGFQYASACAIAAH